PATVGLLRNRIAVVIESMAHDQYGAVSWPAARVPRSSILHVAWPVDLAGHVCGSGHLICPSGNHSLLERIPKPGVWATFIRGANPARTYAELGLISLPMAAISRSLHAWCGEDVAGKDNDASAFAIDCHPRL